MTTASTTDTAAYWRALRFYSKSWQMQYGADMVAMMDAADDGDDPLNRVGRRSLRRSGLCQRFGARPYLWLWLALVLLSTGTYTWSASRMMGPGLYADLHGTSGDPDAGLWLAAISAAAIFLVSITILTVSVLHVPPMSRPPVKPGRWAWTAWLALAGSLVVPLLGTLFAVIGLSAGARLYRHTRQDQYPVLAGLSVAATALTALVALPSVTMSLIGGLG